MRKLEEIKKAAIALLQSKKIAGKHSQGDFDKNTLRSGYINHISSLFDQIIESEQEGEWHTLLTFLMQKRIDLYMETPNKAQGHTTSTFGDALRAVHEALLSYLAETARTEPTSIESQAIKHGENVLDLYNKGGLVNRVDVAAYGYHDVLPLHQPPQSRYEQVKGWSNFFSNQSPKSYPAALYSPNKQVRDWVQMILTGEVPQENICPEASLDQIQPQKQDIQTLGKRQEQPFTNERALNNYRQFGNPDLSEQIELRPMLPRKNG